MTEPIRLLTFNIYFGRAVSEVALLIQKHRPDVVCVQEFEINDHSIKEIEKTGYHLADYSHSFFKFFKFFGIATFYNPQTVTYSNGISINLSKSLYEFLLLVFGMSKGGGRTVLKTVFTQKDTNGAFSVYNLHLTAMQATNKTRDSQIKTLMEHVSQDHNKQVLISGDFNYAYKRKNFEETFLQNGLSEVTTNIDYTCETKVLGLFNLRVKLDYVLCRGCGSYTIERLEREKSDHYPLLASFTSI